MITIDELEHLSQLARIKLSEDDKKSLIKEFDSILSYIDQLKKSEVSIDNEGRLGAVVNVTREDVAKSISKEDRERLLDEAPERVDDYIAVKKVFPKGYEN